ncbi:DNA polymerase Y family protein [Planctomicrobium sp. SH661]|uniref:DNA polymerase Y family protein n=1 Tax=Planctomicrobium sp. SH661 TaxID=3448124 RepID=UPI003F5C51A9
MIGHLDADCFYVSAERVRRPALHRLAVGVLGNQGAAVIAKSYEMKARGIKTGQPIWEARKLCPDGVFIKRDFQWYETLSRLMLEAVQAQSPTVEYYSIDEFFFDADRIDPHALQNHILQAVGVPVTIGISRSRTLAKLASDAGKPFGCRVLIDPEDIASYVESIDIQEVTGIASRSAAKLAQYGIKTVGDFRRADAKLINRLLTKTGEALYWELHGRPLTKIATRRPMHKAIARGGSIGESTDDPTIHNAWLVRNVERLIEAMFWHRYACNRLTVTVAHKIGGLSRQTRLPECTNAFEILLPAAKHLFALCPPGIISHIHVIADELQFVGQHQKSLFTSQPRLDAIKRMVNEKLGRFKVRSAETLPLTEIYTDDAHNHDICDVYGKTCF